MRTTTEKLQLLKMQGADNKIVVMIVGLGSVGNYVLDYLLSSEDPSMEIYVVGRDAEKMTLDANAARVSSLIRQQNRTKVHIVGNVDLNDVSSIERCLTACKPDIIVNSSRAYPGLKYGSLSWNSIRAYGLWAPLAIKYVRNLTEAHRRAGSMAIVINTSYSDVVIPWLKSAGHAYPDFGSGNVNHLIPRIKFAVAWKCDISDYWNIDVTYATSHFHDVVISNEGHVEGVPQLIDIRYGGEALALALEDVFALCCIPMPRDSKRNMMNASSNYEIIQALLAAVRKKKKTKLHCPGIFGEIGGYPTIIDGTSNSVDVYIDESRFSLADMRQKNRESIYLDGIEDVKDGVLHYTDELRQKVQASFDALPPQKVPFDQIDEMATWLITNIIERNSKSQ